MPTEEASARTLLIIVSVIGAIFTIVMIILFFNAAPARSDIPDHQTYTDPAACLKCHLRGTEQSPTMPHLNVGSCHICHQIGKGKETGITKRSYFLIVRPPMPDAAIPVRSVSPTLTVPQPLNRVLK